MRIVDVSAVPIGPPGRGDELHRTLGAGNAVALHSAELGFDQVDRNRSSESRRRSGRAPRRRSSPGPQETAANRSSSSRGGVPAGNRCRSRAAAVSWRISRARPPGSWGITAAAAFGFRASQRAWSSTKSARSITSAGGWVVGGSEPARHESIADLSAASFSESCDAWSRGDGEDEAPPQPIRPRRSSRLRRVRSSSGDPSPGLIPPLAHTMRVSVPGER